MGKVIAIEQNPVGFSGGASVECIDLDSAGKAFQILRCLDVLFVQLDPLTVALRASSLSPRSW